MLALARSSSPRSVVVTTCSAGTKSEEWHRGVANDAAAATHFRRLYTTTSKSPGPGVARRQVRVRRCAQEPLPDPMAWFTATMTTCPRLVPVVLALGQPPIRYPTPTSHTRSNLARRCAGGPRKNVGRADSRCGRSACRRAPPGHGATDRAGSALRGGRRGRTGRASACLSPAAAFFARRARQGCLVRRPRLLRVRRRPANHLRRPRAAGGVGCCRSARPPRCACRRPGGRLRGELPGVAPHVLGRRQPRRGARRHERLVDRRRDAHRRRAHHPDPADHGREAPSAPRRRPGRSDRDRRT